jgi:hypothetical protein
MEIRELTFLFPWQFASQTRENSHATCVSKSLAEGAEPDSAGRPFLVPKPVKCGECGQPMSADAEKGPMCGATRSA